MVLRISHESSLNKPKTPLDLTNASSAVFSFLVMEQNHSFAKQKSAMQASTIKKKKKQIERERNTGSEREGEKERERETESSFGI